MILPRQKIQAVCRSLKQAVAAVRSGPLPRTRPSLELENRLLRLLLGALKIRNVLYPGPSLERILMRGWRRGWRKPTTDAEREALIASVAARRCGTATPTAPR